MAHLIEEREGQEASVFVVKDPAWHGLGTVLDNPATAEEAIKYANLDFNVNTKPVKFDIGVDGEQHLIDVPNKRVTYRTDTNQPLGVVGDIYHVLQNREVFGFFDHLIEEGEAVYHSAGVLGCGEKIWVLAKMPESVVIGGEDIIDMYVLLHNSHDGSSSIVAAMTPIRVVCNNTLTAALGTTKNKINIRHTIKASEKLREAHKVLGLSNIYTGAMTDLFEHLANTQMNSQKVAEFLDGLLPKNPETKFRTAGDKMREAILESYEISPGSQLATARGTAFGMYNAVTHYLDHVKEYESEDTKLKSIWLGNSGALRQKSLDILVSLN